MQRLLRGISAPKFMLFCDTEEFIISVHAGEIIAFDAVEKTHLKEINVKKTLRGPEEKLSRDGFETALPTDFSVLEFSGAAVQSAFERHAGLPI